MRIGLFIPCFIDAFLPEVGIATLELLERFGHEVIYPRDQTCCGQPMANAGFNADCADTEALFVRNFSGFDYIVVAIRQLRSPCARQFRCDRTDAGSRRTFVRGPSNSSSSCTTSKKWMHFRGPGFRTGSGCTTAAARLRRLNHASAVRTARTVLFQARGSAFQGRGYRVRHAVAAGRVLRLRRHFLGLRRGRLRQDGLRQGQRSCPGRRRVHRFGRQLLPDAPAGLRRARSAYRSSSSTSPRS